MDGREGGLGLALTGWEVMDGREGGLGRALTGWGVLLGGQGRGGVRRGGVEGHRRRRGFHHLLEVG